MFKSVSFYVCTIIFLIMMTSTITGVRALEKEGLKQESAGYESDIETEENEEEIMLGVGSDPLIIAEGKTLGSCMNSVYSGQMIQLIILLIIGIFICNEFSSGYIKNTITIPKHRWYFNISKLVTALIVIVVENVVALLAFVFSIRFLFRDVRIGDIKPLVSYLALETLLLLGMVALTLLVCNILRNKVVGVTFAFLMGCQIVILPVLLVFSMLLKYKVETVSKFLLTMTSGIITPGLGKQSIIETLVLGISTVLIYTVASNLIISKKDVG